MIKFLSTWLLLCFLIPFGIASAYCQKTGKVEVLVQDARITTLVEKHIALNENRGTI